MNIIGYVISGPSGDYDTDKLYSLAEAKSIVRAERRALDDDGSCEPGLAIGAVYADGSVSFEV